MKKLELQQTTIDAGSAWVKEHRVYHFNNPKTHELINGSDEFILDSNTPEINDLISLPICLLGRVVKIGLLKSPPTLVA